MGLEQWGATEQYYKIASVHPEYELGRVISQEKDFFVLVEYSFKGDVAVIHKVLPRKSVFIRKAAGKKLYGAGSSC